MQEEKTTKDFCNKIQLFLQKGVGFSQTGKGDRQAEVTALTTAIKAGGEQEAYLEALSAFGRTRVRQPCKLAFVVLKSSFLYVTYCLH